MLTYLTPLCHCMVLEHRKITSFAFFSDEISESLIKEYLYLSIGQLNIPTDPGGPNLQDNKDDNILKELCTKSCPGCTCRMEDEPKQDEVPQNSNGSTSDIAADSSMVTNDDLKQSGESHQPECKVGFIVMI